MMCGIFVNEPGCIRYASALAGGYKTIETRNRNMLKDLIGKRVAIIRTKRGQPPMVVGYARIAKSAFCKAEDFQNYFSAHLVPPGSKFDARGRGKWFYYMADATKCDPYLLPADAIRHGRSWCEFKKGE